MRLIDAADVKKRGDCYLPGIRNAVANILRHTKTVKDAVVVVRCRDCVHHEDEEPGTVWCNHMVGSWVPEDWFCADGERRAEDE